jgi:hypothetical protein
VAALMEVMQADDRCEKMVGDHHGSETKCASVDQILYLHPCNSKY